MQATSQSWSSKIHFKFSGQDSDTTDKTRTQCKILSVLQHENAKRLANEVSSWLEEPQTSIRLSQKVTFWDTDASPRYYLRGCASCTHYYKYQFETKRSLGKDFFSWVYAEIVLVAVQAERLAPCKAWEKMSLI